MEYCLFPREEMNFDKHCYFSFIVALFSSFSKYYITVYDIFLTLQCE